MPMSARPNLSNGVSTFFTSDEFARASCAPCNVIAVHMAAALSEGSTALRGG